MTVVSADVPVCRDPVFIIGSPRSGTSGLAWALAQHADLWTSGESHMLSYLLGGGRFDQAFQRAIGAPRGWMAKEEVTKEEFLRYLGIGFNALFTSRSDGLRWVDQTPGYTLIANLLAVMFPQAQFLHILRDGRRVVHSMVHFLEGLSEDDRKDVEGRLNIGWLDFPKACSEWRRYVERAMGFCDRHPSRSLTVRLEDLSEDPEPAFRKILEFLRVPYEPGVARFFSTHRVNSSFSSGSREQRVVDPEPWNSWTPEEREIFAKEAGPTLVQYGFADAQDVEGLLASHDS